MKKTTSKQPSSTTSSRPPVVAVLGHVDHGKTTLLDAIRKTDVAQKEHGGITQAIGAFTHNNITFIDTPGHEAFARMRSRGVNASDIAVLAVALDDGVMPQTSESIAHIREAKVPYIVALTKADLPSAKPERVKRQLSEEGVELEGLGGDVPVVSVSAKTGRGITELLDIILLLSQMIGIKASAKGIFEGVVIEAMLDQRKGPLATIIVREGTLGVGDEIVAENVSCRVKALTNDRAKNVAEATPGMPVEVLGFSGVPSVGAKVMKKEKTESKPSFPAVYQLANPPSEAQMEPPERQLLPIILKVDTQGSLEAILQSEVIDDVRVIFKASGSPTEGDVLLAKASGAIIAGFNVQTPSSVLKLAENEGVIIKTYRLIYELIEEVKEAAAAFREGKPQEVVLGKAKIVATFPYDKKKVAGCKVLEGRIAKGDTIRVEREGALLGEGKVVSLRHGKENISKAETLSECGVLLGAQLDFEPGDMILSVRYA